MGQHDSPHVFHKCAVLANSRKVVHDHDKCVPLKYRADIPLNYVTAMATYIDQCAGRDSSSYIYDKRLLKRRFQSLRINLASGLLSLSRVNTHAKPSIALG